MAEVVADAVASMPSGPRSRKGHKTRARLIDAAKAVFERDGFLTARISDIVAEAGISHGAFYHYFDSKEQIFREIASEQEVSMLRLVDGHERADHASASDDDHDPIERIRAANATYLKAYKAEAAIMRVIEEVSRYDDYVYEVRRERQREFAERIAHSIRHLQQQGRADSTIDAEFAAIALGGMVAKFAEMWLVQGFTNFGLQRTIDQLTLLWTNAIGLHPAKPAQAPQKKK